MCGMLRYQEVVPHLGGIFSEVKSLRSRAQGPNISCSAPGAGPQGPKKNKIKKPKENTGRMQLLSWKERIRKF